MLKHICIAVILLLVSVILDCYFVVLGSRLETFLL